VTRNSKNDRNLTRGSVCRGSKTSQELKGSDGNFRYEEGNVMEKTGSIVRRATWGGKLAT